MEKKRRVSVRFMVTKLVKDRTKIQTEKKTGSRSGVRLHKDQIRVLCSVRVRFRYMRRSRFLLHTRHKVQVHVQVQVQISVPGAGLQIDQRSRFYKRDKVMFLIMSKFGQVWTSLDMIMAS